MKATLWGTRGSLASPGPDTIRYGGNTSCVSVEGREGTLLVLDAGTGIRGLGMKLPEDIRRVNILLTHLHMDHLQGLPFFAPLRRPGVEVHIWGPASTTTHLSDRLKRYLSPPLFPLSIRELPNEMVFHELPKDWIEIGEFRLNAHLVVHPNPTLGYRIEDGSASITYLPDHEPALGVSSFPGDRDWTSGIELAEGTDLLIHDAQYTQAEYLERTGFGHSDIHDAIKFAELASVREFVPFHHDPAHHDDVLDRMIADSVAELQPAFRVGPGKEGSVFRIGAGGGSAGSNAGPS